MLENDTETVRSKPVNGTDDTILAHESTGSSNTEVISQLQETDWGEEWKQLQRIRRKVDDSQYWNKRSHNFDSKDSPSDYVLEFLELAQIQPGETVLDMGCGTGSIAVPLAQQGCPVIAADFSQGMLDELNRRMKAFGVSQVEPKLMSWADDWHALGIADKSVDVAIASRSIATDDMAAALDKLHNVARRRCCLTLPTGCSPRMDARVLEIIAPIINMRGTYCKTNNATLSVAISIARAKIPLTRLKKHLKTWDAWLTTLLMPAKSNTLPKPNRLCAHGLKTS